MSQSPTNSPKSLPHIEKLEHDHVNEEFSPNLRRQLSVQLTAEQFERLYLQPGE
jgi:hypothetical protein